MDVMGAELDPSRLLTLRGFVERDVAALFIEQLAELEGPVRIDLSKARLEDAEVAAMLAEGLRQTARRLKSLELVGAPRALAQALEAAPSEDNVAITFSAKS